MPNPPVSAEWTAKQLNLETRVQLPPVAYMSDDRRRKAREQEVNDLRSRVDAAKKERDRLQAEIDRAEMEITHRRDNK
jgi:septal ring factor EnvC (AmiA/AmiB activator)